MGRSRDWRLYARGTALQDIAADDGKHLAGKNERWDVKSCDET